ncbi:MAG: hypothetical protein MJA27_06445 [Pseudanabaenales cyanobacterium]|nr:hypothetical protein [Pseudanabaenales cyanobacterium]
MESRQLALTQILINMENYPALHPGFGAILACYQGNTRKKCVSGSEFLAQICTLMEKNLLQAQLLSDGSGS